MASASSRIVHLISRNLVSRQAIRLAVGSVFPAAAATRAGQRRRLHPSSARRRPLRAGATLGAAAAGGGGEGPAAAAARAPPAAGAAVGAAANWAPRLLHPAGSCDFGSVPQLPEEEAPPPPPPQPLKAAVAEAGAAAAVGAAAGGGAAPPLHPLPAEHDILHIPEVYIHESDEEWSDGEWSNETEVTTAGEVLRAKTKLVKVQHVPESANLMEAIEVFCNHRVSSVLVHDAADRVVGLFTARDVLREVHQAPRGREQDAFGIKVSELMIPLAQLIYCRPEHSLKQCHLIMKECKVRNLPVLGDGEVLGILTIKDISDYSFQRLRVEWKQNKLEAIGARKGIPRGTALGGGLREPAALEKLRLAVGAAALPHPFKQPDGVAFSKRQFTRLGNREYATDVALSEDAHFVLKLPWPHAHGATVTYLGVADGVGSWRGRGVDPRLYPQRLMHAAQQAILAAAPTHGGPGPLAASGAPMPPLSPIEVLQRAWHRTTGNRVTGSCTACIATLDQELHQLAFSNVGDTGVMVLRHIDAGRAGYMGTGRGGGGGGGGGGAPSHPAAGHPHGGGARAPQHGGQGGHGGGPHGAGAPAGFRIAFLSQQQFKSFNLPYQLGYDAACAEDGLETGCGAGRFETPADADTTAYPVIPGDVIIIATDGLFDNVELDEICRIATGWEEEWFGGAMRQLGEPAHGAAADLADRLCQRARELSLDDYIDSPFAVLAKENDIMWGGGMPDDCTVLAIRVVKKKQTL